MAAQQSSLTDSIKHRFNLIDDKATPQEIDADIRSAITMEGSNLWILMLAIIIASAGLNVNSTAVVIGAMLISPLMGPINGVGYGIAIYDFALIRESLVNLGVATLIGLVASTMYFLVTPLGEAHSEILSRTQPTIWDVIIAFTGGLAGIIGATRKTKTNVIPGVAIATALMPPLCTAGYGLATQTWHFFLGASYLFLINCVFIALAAVLIISTSHLPHKKFVNKKTEAKIKRILSMIVIIMLVPSTYLAYKLVNQEVFTKNVEFFLHNQLHLEGSHITETDIDPKKRAVALTIIGKSISEKEIAKINVRLNNAVDGDASLTIYQAGREKVDTLSLKTSILSELYKNSQFALDTKNQEIDALKSRIIVAQDKIAQLHQANNKMNMVIDDITRLFPQITHVAIADGMEIADGSSVTDVTIVVLHMDKALEPEEEIRIHDWLRFKLNTNRISLITELNEPEEPIEPEKPSKKKRR